MTAFGRFAPAPRAHTIGMHFSKTYSAVYRTASSCSCSRPTCAKAQSSLASSTRSQTKYGCRAHSSRFVCRLLLCRRKLTTSALAALSLDVLQDVIHPPRGQNATGKPREDFLPSVTPPLSPGLPPPTHWLPTARPSISTPSFHAYSPFFSELSTVSFSSNAVAISSKSGLDTWWAMFLLYVEADISRCEAPGGCAEEAREDRLVPRGGTREEEMPDFELPP